MTAIEQLREMGYEITSVEEQTNHDLAPREHVIPNALHYRVIASPTKHNGPRAGTLLTIDREVREESAVDFDGLLRAVAAESLIDVVRGCC